MRRTQAIVLAAALLFSGAAVWIANGILGGQAAQEAPAAATESVLVASRDIQPGTTVREDELRWEQWPAGVAGDRYWRKGIGEEPATDVVGKVARRRFSEGEPIARDGIADRRSAGLLSALLEPGMRAVSVPLSPTTSVAGFVLPGDRVDVVLSQNVKASIADGSKTPASIQRFATETILSDVKVIAIDEKLSSQPQADKPQASGKTDQQAGADAPQPTGNLPGRTATLELDPRDAKVIITASRLGELSLVLRSADHAKGEAGDGKVGRGADGYVADTDVGVVLGDIVGGRGDPQPQPSGGGESRTIILNRAGSTTQAQIPKR